MQASKIAFLECDVKNKQAEVDLLEAKKKELIRECAANLAEADALTRSLRQANLKT